MLRGWCELLPLFVLRWLSKEKCEVVWRSGKTFANVRPGVLIQTDTAPKSGPVVVKLGRA